MAKSLTVVFSEKMVAPEQGASPSAAKPAQVVAAWQKIPLPLNLVDPVPATMEELCRAHDSKFVQDILNSTRPNGFGTQNKIVSATFPYTSGAMLTGAKIALNTKSAVCAPVSGFHHAGWQTAEGFCTFNGLMVTALALQAEKLAERVMILDCDQHYGNGTDAIMQRLQTKNIHHYTAGRFFYDDPTKMPLFLTVLEKEIKKCKDFDVVLYQAGADPHINDPHGGWMTTEQMRQRDGFVFEQVKSYNLPIVWNLAGGYQRDKTGGIAPVVEIHVNTAQEHLRVFSND